MIFGTIGVHPHECDSNIISSNEIIRCLNENTKIIGVGETGLDFYYDNSDRKKQISSFRIHIEASIDGNVPLIVHSRIAEKDTFDILNNEIKNSNLKVLMHCFTGSLDFAKKLIDLNCYISVSGIITFKNSTDLVNTVSEIPLENLLVETDAPFLAPIPYRGKPNEPSYLIHTINKLSEIKKTFADEIIEKTTNNFFKLFKLI